MDEQEKAIYLGWAELPRLKAKIAQAGEIIDKALDIEKAYVACSWGKDSLVLSHLVLSINPAIPIVHIGSEHQNLFDNYADVEASFLSQFPCDYKKVDLGLKNAKTTFEKLKKELPPLAFVGLRAQEGKHRKASLCSRGVICQYKKGGFRACPLAWWDWKDIWGYIVANNLDYLNSYDHPNNNNRVLSRTSVHVGSGRGLTMGRFERMRKINPEYYDFIKNELIGL